MHFAVIDVHILPVITADIFVLVTLFAGALRGHPLVTLNFLLRIVVSLRFTVGCNHRFLRYMLICATEIVEQLELIILVKWHHAVTHVAHVLLRPISRSELPVTAETQLAKLDTLSDVSQYALQIGEALDVQDGEVVTEPHVVQVLLDTIAFNIAEKADAQRLQCRLGWQQVFVGEVDFWHAQRFITFVD